jgi:hypothetical protein
MKDFARPLVIDLPRSSLRKLDPRTAKRRNPGTFGSRAAAERHEREVQYFKRQ